ncbi:hypothetical protein [Methanobacterium aggregans]|uniref:hypothetical protein n=1 Tax=Methanobacterium aggregans TaxID=1615586 RepID=UPI001AE569CD|nr:hypothetical protein [Methanobacterium aggregans]MBP2046822.1 hypothetical protein [Methanobacterium aggregans]
MKGKIFKIRDDNELVVISEEQHRNENDFQSLIKEHPELIPGDQIDSENPRRWIVVGREIKNMDVFLLDQDGIPTIVEVKKIDNNEIHRLVVAQLLDYGSKLFSHTVEEIRENIRKYSPVDLKDFLNNEITEEEFLEKVKKNLEEENMRLIVVSDGMPRNLQNIIEFLNNNMKSIEVLGVEIKQYPDDQTGTKTIVPRLVGQSRDIMFFEPPLEKETFFENLDTAGVEFYQELISFADVNDLKEKWTKTGFFLTVPLEEAEVKILHCYSNRYNFGQNVFSTNFNIVNEVRGGEEIFEKFLDDTLELNDFVKVGDGFNFSIEKNLDEDQWKEFKRILLETKEEIVKNGVIEEET